MPKLNFAQYRKFYAAALFAGLTAAQTALPLTQLEHGWVTVVLAALGAVAVRRVPNAQEPPAS